MHLPLQLVVTEDVSLLIIQRAAGAEGSRFFNFERPGEFINRLLLLPGTSRSVISKWNDWVINYFFGDSANKKFPVRV